MHLNGFSVQCVITQRVYMGNTNGYYCMNLVKENISDKFANMVEWYVSLDNYGIYIHIKTFVFECDWVHR